MFCILPFTFRSVVHWVNCEGVKSVSRSFILFYFTFACGYPVVSAPFVENTLFAPFFFFLPLLFHHQRSEFLILFIGELCSKPGYLTSGYARWPLVVTDSRPTRHIYPGIFIYVYVCIYIYIYVYEYTHLFLELFLHLYYLCIYTYIFFPQTVSNSNPISQVSFLPSLLANL